MRQRTAFRLAWGVWAVSLGALFAPLIYRFTHGSFPGFTDEPGSWAPLVTILLFIPAFATTGAILAWKRPSNPIGWLLSGSGLSFALGTFAILITHFSATWGDWLSNWVWGLGSGLPAFVLLLFPNGALPSRRWRPVAWFSGIVLGATFLGNAFAPGVILDSHSANPVGIGGPVGTVLSSLQGHFGLILLSGLAAIISLVFRYRRAESLERQQIKWLVYAAALLVVGVVVASVVTGAIGASVFSNNIQNAIVSGSLLFVPLAIGVAVMRYRLYDIDVVINKTVVFGALAAFITAVYVAVVVGVGFLIGAGDRPNTALSIAATAVVAVAFQPVRERVQRFANRLVYGQRTTPYEALASFSERIAGTYATEDVLPRTARVIADGLAAERAVVWLRAGDRIRVGATWPENGAGTSAASVSIALAGADLPEIPGADRVVPVTYREQLLGAISVTKPRGDPLTPAEAALLSDLAGQAGMVLSNVGLAADLQARLDEIARRANELRDSRQRIVLAHDAERRRLERNIHDGAQQHLVALAVKVRLARTLLERDPAGGREALRTLRKEVDGAMEALTSLALGIYPPVLEERGVVAALEEQAGLGAVPVRVEADGVGRHPVETEAAVYFCCLEAIQNAAKYASPSLVTVRLGQERGRLVFAVSDDGAGFDPGATPPGSGLGNMADRLSVLGGDVEVVSAPGSGTTVRGSIPVGSP